VTIYHVYVLNKCLRLIVDLTYYLARSPRRQQKKEKNVWPYIYKLLKGNCHWRINWEGTCARCAVKLLVTLNRSRPTWKVVDRRTTKWLASAASYFLTCLHFVATSTNKMKKINTNILLECPLFLSERNKFLPSNPSELLTPNTPNIIASMNFLKAIKLYHVI